MTLQIRVLACIIGFLTGPLGITVCVAEPRHAIAMHGAPALPPGFDALPDVNPDAPKGGELVQYVLGTFESVNTDAARSYVTFRLDPRARFSDGQPVTAEDVIFSWKLLRDHGRPNFHT